MSEPRSPSNRLWLVLALGLIAGWFVYLIAFGPRGPRLGALPPPSLKAPARPVMADYRWTLLDLDDRPVEFAKFRGRAVFLNLWGTFCPPCVEEMPSIANLAGQRRVKDVAFVCVSTDPSAEVVRTFLEGKNWPLTILRATELPEVFMTEGLPTTFLIAPSGQVVAVDEGAAQWDDPSAVDFLEALAKRGTSRPAANETAASVKP